MQYLRRSAASARAQALGTLNVLLTCAKLLGAEFSNRRAFPHASGLRLVHHAVREPDGLHRSNEAPAS